MLQGVEGGPLPAAATITASATGFSNGTGTVNIVQPALQISSLPTSITSLSGDNPFQVFVGVPNGQANVTPVEAVRVGSTALTVTVTQTNPAAAQLRTPALTGQTVTVTIAPGQSTSPTTVAAGGVAFDPLAAGQTTVSASIPGFIVTTAGTIAVTITP